MAEPVYTLGIELQTGSYTDVTTRVERASWGQTIVDMFNPPAVGRAIFVLANDDGAMSPRVNSSFQPGRNIQLTVVCSSIQYSLFTGRVTDISLRSHIGARTTIVEAEDDWVRLRDVKWTTKLYSGTNAVSLFTELMSMSDVRSFQVDTVNITSDHNLGYIWYRDMPAVDALNEFVSAGNYQMLVDGAGTYQLRGRNWSRFDTNSTPQFDVSSWAAMFRSSMSRNTVYNRIKISGQQLVAALNPATVIYMPPAITGYDSAIPISAGLSKGFWFTYSDPFTPNRSEVPVYSMVSMVASQDWYFSANNDGTGADLTSGCTVTASFFAASGVTTYTNNNAVTAYLARSQARGYLLQPTGDLVAQIDIASSQTRFGLHVFTMSNRILQWQANEYIGSLATHIASDRKDGMHTAQLTLQNQFWVQYLNNSLGNIILVIDPFSGPDTTWRTRGTNHQLDMTKGLLHTTVYDLDTPQSPMGWGTPVEVSAFGLFSKGTAGGGTNKYTYHTDAVTTGTDLSASVVTLDAAAGNSTLGLFAGGIVGGSHSASTRKYTYSTDAVVAGTNLSAIRSNHAAAGTSTVGYYGGGYDTVSFLKSVTKYTYSGDTVSAGTDYPGTSTRRLHAAAGNATRGIHAAGNDDSGTPIIATTVKYTYSGDTTAAGTSLATARNQHAASGSETIGYFGAGAPGLLASVEKYTYASDGVAGGTNLLSAKSQLAATGTKSVGIWGGGVTDETEKYTYSSDAVAYATLLSIQRQQYSASSSLPGGF